jgi:hypothetical protein
MILSKIWNWITWQRLFFIHLMHLVNIFCINTLPKGRYYNTKTLLNIIIIYFRKLERVQRMFFRFLSCSLRFFRTPVEWFIPLSLLCWTYILWPNVSTCCKFSVCRWAVEVYHRITYSSTVIICFKASTSTQIPVFWYISCNISIFHTLPLY